LGILGVAVAVALVPSLPYGYYSALRWLVFGLGAWLALDAHRRGNESWTWTWAIIAGIYNPIFPVHADRGVWSVINLATVVAAFLTYDKTRVARSKETPHE
jgi:hypothetical protein